MPRKINNNWTAFSRLSIKQSKPIPYSVPYIKQATSSNPIPIGSTEQDRYIQRKLIQLGITEPRMQADLITILKPYVEKNGGNLSTQDFKTALQIYKEEEEIRKAPLNLYDSKSVIGNRIRDIERAFRNESDEDSLLQNLGEGVWDFGFPNDPFPFNPQKVALYLLGLMTQKDLIDSVLHPKPLTTDELRKLNKALNDEVYTPYTPQSSPAISRQSSWIEEPSMPPIVSEATLGEIPEENDITHDWEEHPYNIEPMSIRYNESPYVSPFSSQSSTPRSENPYWDSDQSYFGDLQNLYGEGIRHYNRRRRTYKKVQKKNYFLKRFFF